MYLAVKETSDAFLPKPCNTVRWIESIGDSAHSKTHKVRGSFASDFVYASIYFSHGFGTKSPPRHHFK